LSLNPDINCLNALGTDTPVHLVMTNVGPMGGFGLGLGMNNDPRPHVSDALSAGVTTKKFWSVDASRTIRGDRTYHEESEEFVFAGRYRAMPELAFYGLGPKSPSVATNYGLDEGRLSFRWHWLDSSDFVWDFPIEVLVPRVSSATVSAFTAAGLSADAPGLTEQSDFVRVGVGTTWRPQASTLIKGDARAAVDLFGSVTGPHQTFGRASVRGNLVCDDCLGEIDLAALATFSHPFQSGGVPFFYQPALGGRDADEGFDTMRGFADLRFQGLHRVLFQADYVAPDPCFNALRPRVFTDIGQVARRASDFALSNVRKDVGIGLDLFLGNQSVLRGYWAYGLGEGGRFGGGLSLGM
jgi:hypothetical protein